ncbi:MAG: response regulator, partial [Deltaproteobacteria bacterium]
SNLLSNAIKFTPRGGRIEIRLERAGSEATIAVSDTGPGIGADLLPHVFERFRQGEGPATRRHGGLGLGLTIVRHLVELHGGTVEVESPGELGGATFIVRLPLLPSEAAGGPEIQRLAPLPVGPPRADGLHVLLVDDDANTLDSLRALFEHYGARVTAVPSAAEALRALESLRPDVLVSDIAMPDEDGYQLIARVRELDRERGGAIPAVALTAFAADDDRVRALVAGYDVHLSKPVNPEEVVAFVTQLARRGRAAA